MEIFFVDGMPDGWIAPSDSLTIRRRYWNDWYQWKTTFYLSYVRSDEKVIHIGAVKIADLAFVYEKSHVTQGDETPFPKVLDAPQKNLASIGQDESYYVDLRKALGPARMKEALRLLGDLALDPKRLARVRSVPVVDESLFRTVPFVTATGVFARIIKTGWSQVAFDFSFVRPSENPDVDEPMILEFEVAPNSSPPTNVHVLIGRNGAGKTTVLRSMAMSLLGGATEKVGTPGGWFESGDSAPLDVANVVYVAFSAFDEAIVPVSDLKLADRNYSYVGLQYVGAKEADPEDRPPETAAALAKPKKTQTRTVGDLERIFASSALAVVREKSRELWKAALVNLESDPNFLDADISELADLPIDDPDDEAEFTREARRLYKRLSSGHKIVLLTVTKLVQTVTEKTLVLLDEPEGHLHPPLLSAFTRTLSDLMKARNGIAIIASHSPVILQEVPKRSAYRIVRSGDVQTAERLDKETFGETVGSLTNTIFGLEVTDSGFHRILIESAVRHGSYDRVIDEFNHEVGFEGRAILRAWFATNDVR